MAKETSTQRKRRLEKERRKRLEKYQQETEAETLARKKATAARRQKAYRKRRTEKLRNDYTTVKVAEATSILTITTSTASYSGENRFEKQGVEKNHLTKTAIPSIQLNESYPVNCGEQITTVKNCALPSRTCGLIEVTMGKIVYSLNCIYCAEKFSINHWTSFLLHMEEKHNCFEQDINNDKLQNDNTIVNKENGFLVITSADTQDKILLQQESKISQDITLPKLNYYDKVKEKNMNQEHDTLNGSKNDYCDDFIYANNSSNDQNTDFCSSCGFNLVSLKEHRKQHKRLKLLKQNKLLLDFATEDNNFESSYNTEFIPKNFENGPKVIKVEDGISVLEVEEQMQVNERTIMQFDDTNIKMEEFLDI